MRFLATGHTKTIFPLKLGAIAQYLLTFCHFPKFFFSFFGTLRGGEAMVVPSIISSTALTKFTFRTAGAGTSTFLMDLIDFEKK